MVEHAFVLADFGSTFTKVAAVEAGTGRLIARADHPTTVQNDVMIGYRSALEAIAPALGDTNVATLACSSAGGGLKVAVVGLERDITTEAARRVALNSGGRIVATVSGEINADSTSELRSSRADVALIVGGTDGGNRDALLERACAVVATLPHAAAVVAGNAGSSLEAATILEQAGISTKVVANVLPRIGELVAGPARDAIRDAFITHVIGGKKLSSDPAFLDMVLMPTPDAVLQAVELLAGALTEAGSNRPVIVVDVGGATTDVYSVTPGSPESADRGFVPVPTLPARRTVEADVGVRWSAPGIVDAAAALGILSDEDTIRLGRAADGRCIDVSMLPVSEEELALDAELAALAVTVAILRHAGTQEMLLERGGMELHREGPDLRGPALLVLTGGVFRFQGPEMVEKLTMATFDSFDRRHHLLPSDLDIVTDSEYLLATCGLLTSRDGNAALGLLRSALPGLFTTIDTHKTLDPQIERRPRSGPE
jgi:uncharacterized protein (TIGR01319 family)